MKLPGNKVIRIQNYYRQWRMLDIKGTGIKNTETQKQQNTRFAKIAAIWSQQLEQFLSNKFIRYKHKFK